MKMFNVKRLTLETMYIVLLTVTMLPVIQTDAAFDCREAMISTVRKINSWFNGYSIYQLFKHVEEEQGSGRLQTMCKTFREIQSELKHTIYPKCTASDADVHLARIAGFEHICGSGMQDYGRFGKCIDDASSKLATCKMEESDITSIKMKALYGSPDVKSNVCRDMHKYLLCSNDRIEQACGSAEAAQWYQSFVTHVFEEISYYTKMDCSFSNTGGPGANVTNIAIGVGIGVGVLVLLFCLCWCCRVGVCGCCREEEEEDIKYHMPDNNDNDKDPSVHSRDVV